MAKEEQVERVICVDEECRRKLQSLLHGREDLDEVWARGWVEALMMDGETLISELHCCAFNGMPQVSGETSCGGR